MRISTNQIYQSGISGLLLQQEKVLKLKEQLDSNLKVTTSADDPIAFAQIELINQKISTTQYLQKNRQNADSALSLEESILGDCTDTLQRLRELQVRAGNVTLSQEARQALAAEAQVILSQLLDYANSKDLNGDYLFSGGQTSTQPFSLNASGQYIYNGDSTQRFQAVSGSFQVAINDPGDGIFMRIPNGNGTFAISQTSTPNTGSASVNLGSVVNPGAYVPDDYTMSFVLNSQGNLVVMVSGAASGNVLPPTGLPDDAPLYEDGMTVNFNGMQMAVSGTPNPGDAFSITPSQNESIFSTIQSMITNLNQSFSNPMEKAAVGTVNNQLLAQLDSALKSVTTLRTTLGARLNQLEQVDFANIDLMDMSKAVLKSLQEIDPIAVAVEFNQELLNLQAAQESFVKIQGLSLFNFI